MVVKCKKLHPDAVIPAYAKEGDAGLDLTAVWATVSQGIVTYGTGLAFEIPEGYVGLVFPRSSVYKTDQILSNCVGVIDSGYRGEVQFKFYTKTIESNGKIYANEYCYEVGDRIGQLIIMPYPKINLVEVEELSDSERGSTGFGSSGK